MPPAACGSVFEPVAITFFEVVKHLYNWVYFKPVYIKSSRNSTYTGLATMGPADHLLLYSKKNIGSYLKSFKVAPFITVLFTFIYFKTWD